MGAVQIRTPDSEWVLCGHAVMFPHLTQAIIFACCLHAAKHFTCSAVACLWLSVKMLEMNDGLSNNLKMEDNFASKSV